MTGEVPLRYRSAAFLASFLVFQLELFVAKLLLPRYGGGAYVWTTAVAVFQGLVLAAALYAVLLRRLAPGGRLLFHVSSRHLELRPLFAGLAAELGWEGATKRLEPSALPASERTVDASTWVALAPEASSLAALRVVGWKDLGLWPRARPWTDRHTSLLPALSWR